MRNLMKLFVFCLSLSFSTASLARVCFLPGVLSGDGCLEDVEIFTCTGFDRTTPCISGYDQTTCTSHGVTYYRCTCRTDNIVDGLGSKYICSKAYDSVCGCSAADAVCNTTAYPYSSCSEWSGSVPSEDFCVSPRDGKTKYYKSCDCPSDVYPYTCTTEGLKKPNDINSKCSSPSGEVRYSYCNCADSWYTEPCAERNDGCTALMNKVGNGLSTCYLCTASTCPEPTDVNLSTVWCPVPSVAVTDCEQLNYVYAPSGVCANGRRGLKCIYDSNYIYCSN